MKILFCFMGTLNPSCGGVERTMCNLIHELQAHGHECAIVSWYRNTPYEPFSGIQKILPTPSSRIREERQAAFRQALEERQPDIIIHDGELLGAGALFPGPAGRKRLLEAFSGKTPAIVDMHHSDIRGRLRAPFLKGCITTSRGAGISISASRRRTPSSSCQSPSNRTFTTFCRESGRKNHRHPQHEFL